MLYYYIFKNDYEHKLNNFKMSLELRSLSAERLKKPTATQRAQENKKKRASCAAAGAGEPNDSGRRPQRAPRLAAILRDARGSPGRGGPGRAPARQPAKSGPAAAGSVGASSGLEAGPNAGPETPYRSLGLHALPCPRFRTLPSSPLDARGGTRWFGNIVKRLLSGASTGNPCCRVRRGGPDADELQPVLGPEAGDLPALRAAAAPFAPERGGGEGT